jgi:phosphatidate cytidylyltransferase
MLKQRLVFGLLMIAAFFALMIFDGWLDGSLSRSRLDDKPLQGTVFCIFIVLLIIPAQFEMRSLAAARDIKIFTPVAVICSGIFATTWYWRSLFANSAGLYLSLALVFTLFVLLGYQYFRFGCAGSIANCGGNFFSIIYLGLLAGFAAAIRIDYGLWALLMFVSVVKASDIGAYAVGGLIGKHKFSPRVSPGKTWEGMAGAVVTAIIVAVVFARYSDIINLSAAIIFGFCFAFIGQLGDLAESIIKRDAEQKDSSNSVPGFGGILDIIDSPLACAPFAYLFFGGCGGFS